MAETQSGQVRKFGINAVSSVCTRILQLTVIIWVNQYLLKRIRPEEYSLFPLVMSIIVFADLFKAVFTGGLARYIVEADSRGDRDGVTTIVSSMLPILVFGAACFGSAGLVAAWKIEHLINVEPTYVGQARVMLLLLVFTLCLNVVALPFSQGLYVRQEFVKLNLLDLVSEVFRLSLLFGLLVGVGPKVMWLVVASTAASALNVSMRIFVTRRLIPEIRFRSSQICFRQAKTMLHFGAWTSVQGFTSLVANSAPALILNRFGTAVDVAAFHLGRLPDVQLRRLMSAAAVPAQPALTALYATRGEQALHDLYYRGGRYHLWLTLLVVPVFLIFGHQIVTKYAGSQYESAANVVFALLVIYPFAWASAMFYKVAHAVAKIRAYYICDIFVQAAALGALFYSVVFLKKGAAGAAAAMAIANGLLHVVLIWPMGLRLVNGSWKAFLQKTCVPGMLPFFVSLLVCYMVGRTVNVSAWWQIGVAAALSGIVYMAVLIAFCMDEFDRSYFNRFRQKISALAGGKSEVVVLKPQA